MSKNEQVKVHWGNAKEITPQVKEKLQSILHTDERDPRFIAILDAFREASNYQRHIDHKLQFNQTKKELRKNLTDIRKGLLKAQEGMADLSRESERRLDWFSSIRKGEESTMHTEFLKYQATPFKERKDNEFHSGFSILLDEMEQTVKYYLEEIPPGKPKKHQYSGAIRMIAKVFEKHFPEYSLPVNKIVGSDTVFYKVIAIWHDLVENEQYETSHTITRKIEDALVDFDSYK